jgi:hypothetical protein
MDDPLGTMPARYRPVRLPGLLKCCVESVQASGRLTGPGEQLQCHVCQAVLEVDQAGAWCWLDTHT